MAFSKEMQKALKADGEKLRQLTGVDHGPEFWDTCPVCSGFGSHEEWRPQHDDPNFCIVISCTDCGGTGWQQVHEPPQLVIVQ